MTPLVPFLQSYTPPHGTPAVAVRIQNVKGKYLKYNEEQSPHNNREKNLLREFLQIFLKFGIGLGGRKLGWDITDRSKEQHNTPECHFKKKCIHLFVDCDCK